MARPEGMASWQHLDAAEQLLASVEPQVSESYRTQTGESKTDALLTVIAHVLIAHAQMIARQRR